MSLMQERARKVARAVRHRLPGATRRRDILDVLPHGGVAAEIGVWQGDFSQQMLNRLELERLHLVDPWAFRPEYNQSWYGGSVAKNQGDMDEIFDGVQRRFKTEIATERIVVHRLESLAAAETFDPGTFDIVYIDGDHTYEAVWADLRVWAPLVKPRGFLTGDDYGEGGWWGRGVNQAVDEFAESANWPLTLRGGEFAFQRP